MDIKNIDASIDNDFIASELKSRLLEHAPDFLSSENTLELSQEDITFILDGNKLAHQAAPFGFILAPLVFMQDKKWPDFFREVHRVLTPNGVFLFSTLGSEIPNTLEKLGDTLLQVGFQSPVVNREPLQLEYDAMNVLLNDLKASNINEKYINITENTSEYIVLNFEVFYGHALGATFKKPASNKIEIPIKTIKVRQPL